MLYQDIGKQTETIIDDIKIGFGKNSWYFKLPLSSCKNLFEKENVSFQVQAFVCKCGKEHIFITKKDEKKILYTCTTCKNSHFLNVHYYTNKFNDLLANIDVEPKFFINNKYAYAVLHINLPIGIDLSRDTIIFEKKMVYKLRICLNSGEEKHQESHIITSDIVNDTYNKLLSYIDENYLTYKLKNYTSLNMKEQSPSQFRKIVSFFLKYSSFTNAYFFFWHMDKSLYQNGGIDKTPEIFLNYIRNFRQERSIKKSLYSRYLHELNDKKFDPLTPYIICHSFKDPNLICRLLDNHHFSLRNTISGNMKDQANEHIRLIEFLKKYYPEKTLVNMLTTIPEYTSLWSDSVAMFDSILEIELMSKYFQKPRANILAIHNELIKSRQLSWENPRNIEFTYNPLLEKACGLWQQQFLIVLPQTSDELIAFSSILHNCLYGFVKHIFEKKTTIYGVKYNNNLVYAIEIIDGTIIQMYGKHNSIIEEPHRSSLLLWYEYYFGSDKK